MHSACPWIAAACLTALGPAADAQPATAQPTHLAARDAVRVSFGFGPYIDGQNPDLGSTVSVAQVRERLAIIAPYTDWVRSFGALGGLESIGPEAHALGLKHAASAWLDDDPATNQLEIQALIGLATNGHAELLIVGSETLLRGDLSSAELIAAIQQVRAAAPGIPVTTAETYREWHEHPELLAEVDLVLANYYPFWEGVPISEAVDRLACWHGELAAAAAPLTVVVSETGWPSDGPAVGAAQPSLPHAARYFREFTTWARDTGTMAFYFEALDETWKATVEGPVGAHWGIWEEDGQLKPGMAAVFAGLRQPPALDTPCLPGGPGSPTLELTYVPPVQVDADLEGQLWHVSPITHRVAVYIRVHGGWWSKPTFDSPSTVPDHTGAFVTDIVTGGDDLLADQVAAYLLPAGVTPPKAEGGPLPSALAQLALDGVVVDK